MDQEETLILLEPVEAQNLYGVDEDGDGLVDYLVIEEPDTLVLRGEEADEVPEGG
jgi:hypothetical protein